MTEGHPGGERLQKVLAASGIASRRAAEELIRAGRVTVDGEPAELGRKVDPDREVVAVDGRPIAKPGSPIHLALNKPAGVTATVRDRHAAQTVLDLVPRPLSPAGARLYPVGRLDRDSEGLVILTNDGEWAERVLHPRYGVEREYAVALAHPLDAEAARELSTGIELDEGIARFTHVRLATSSETRSIESTGKTRAGRGRGGAAPLTWYRVTLDQGWNRQVRRMFRAVGAPIVRLVRVRIGSLRLGSLAPGEVRPLTGQEVRALGRGIVVARPPARSAPGVTGSTRR